MSEREHPEEHKERTAHDTIVALARLHRVRSMKVGRARHVPTGPVKPPQVAWLMSQARAHFEDRYQPNLSEQLEEHR